MPTTISSRAHTASMQREALRDLLAERAMGREPAAQTPNLNRNFDIDCTRVTLSAAGAHLAGRLVFDHVRVMRLGGVRVDGIGGMTLGADPIAVAASLISAQVGEPVDSFVLRTDLEKHDMPTQLETGCACMGGAHVLLLEDVVTSGASTLQAVHAAQRAGLVPVGIVALVDCERGAQAALSHTGIPFSSILCRSDLAPERAPGADIAAAEVSAAPTLLSGAKRLIVALDVPDAAETMRLALAVGPHVSMVKLGLESFVAHGPALVRQIRAEGIEVFLDLKLHDTPRTVAAAVRQACALDVQLLTIHAAGGAHMIRAAVQANTSSMRIVAVTVLTSLDDEALADLGFGGSCAQTAFQLGAMAMAAGADGLVCSASDLDALRPLGGLRVVPAIRQMGSASDDQARRSTPQYASERGADWLVVGRPITQSAQPVQQALAFAAAIHGDAANR